MATVPVAAPQVGTGSDLLFVGSNTSPNVAALRWCFDEVWPSVRRANPAARFTVAGNVAAMTVGRCHENFEFKKFLLGRSKQ
jgi:hypothetical protein